MIPEIKASHNKRIISIDIMRGFSILGIFLVNMLSFHSPILYYNPLDWWEGPLNQGVYQFIDVFAQGSFYPLFSLLFGYGIVILRENTLNRGLSFTGIGVRRLSLLLLIGGLHATFIWHGDILVNYALLGFLLMLFLRFSGKALIITGSLLYIIPNILLSLLFIVTVLFVPAGEIDMYNIYEAQESVEVYQEGTYLEITERRLKDWYAVNNVAGMFFMLVTIFPLFLIGAGAAKLKWLEQYDRNKRRFLIMFIVTFSLGLLMKLSPYVIDKNFASEFIQDSIGGPLLAIAFAMGIALLSENPLFKKSLSVLAPVGKLSMSNYLLQSIVCTLIFYSYGLGYYGQISAFTGTLLALGIFTLQIVLSHFWIKYFAYGPFEWAWRSFTYWKIQRWKKS
ncbi:DUF418 domain-containing protein [Cytobacillus sp. FJAT-54145]|uniref:DUF418 domain-containing protein n=1 Tax=Cytobacillus spartinae TaxID=3299023 RepID=A0ABW6KC07_9BACI